MQSLRASRHALLLASRPSSSPAAAAASSAALHTRAALSAATPSSSSPSPPSPPKPRRQVGATPADMIRLFREQQRAAAERELFPWEKQQVKLTAWEPKYEDEKRFYYASKTQEGQKNLDGRTFHRYLGGFGSRYLLSKHALRSPSALSQVDMTRPSEVRVELSMASGVLPFYYLLLETGQLPRSTAKPQLESARVKTKATKALQLDLSRERLYPFLSTLHALWPRKDERDVEWKKMPRREHGQYRLKLSRVLAEGPSKPLNAATQSFIDHLEYQLTFHFRESKKQNRNINWLQFMGVPGIKVNKKWGGEIKIPTLRALEG